MEGLFNFCRCCFFKPNNEENIQNNQPKNKNNCCLSLLISLKNIINNVKSLIGRVCKKSTKSKKEEGVDQTAKNKFFNEKRSPNDKKEKMTVSENTQPKSKDKTSDEIKLKKENTTKAKPVTKKSKKKEVRQPIQTEATKKVLIYPGDLNDIEKMEITLNLADEYKLQAKFTAFSKTELTICRKDIFEMGTEEGESNGKDEVKIESRDKVIVNAANTHLGGGGGIDGVIHKKGKRHYAEAHQKLQEQYKSNYVRGHAAMIESGKIKEKYGIDHVIVVAGPQGETDAKKEGQLYSCYYNSLVLAHSQGKTHIAFPSISTGIFGFPKDRAAAISSRAIYNFLNAHPDTTIKSISIHFLPDDEKENLEIYQEALS
jgi:O-acetyl-ADP-ribose deacetylase (regulator of RNase III)